MIILYLTSVGVLSDDVGLLQSYTGHIILIVFIARLYATSWNVLVYYSVAVSARTLKEHCVTYI